MLSTVEYYVLLTKLFCCRGSGGLEFPEGGACPGPGEVTPLLRLDRDEVGERQSEAEAGPGVWGRK